MASEATEGVLTNRYFDLMRLRYNIVIPCHFHPFYMLSESIVVSLTLFIKFLLGESHFIYQALPSNLG